MKYYYKDKLVRTSNNEYHFASVYESETGFRTLSCSKTMEGANKEITRSINEILRSVDYYDEYLKAIEKGMKHFWYKNYKKEVNETSERVKQYLDYQLEKLDKIRKYCKVVEIEAR